MASGEVEFKSTDGENPDFPKPDSKDGYVDYLASKYGIHGKAATLLHNIFKYMSEQGMDFEEEQEYLEAMLEGLGISTEDRELLHVLTALQDVLDYIEFEAGTTESWPFAVSDDEILTDKDGCSRSPPGWPRWTTWVISTAPTLSMRSFWRNSARPLRRRTVRTNEVFPLWALYPSCSAPPLDSGHYLSLGLLGPVRRVQAQCISGGAEGVPAEGGRWGLFPTAGKSADLLSDAPIPGCLYSRGNSVGEVSIRMSRRRSTKAGCDWADCICKRCARTAAWNMRTISVRQVSAKSRNGGSLGTMVMC